MNRTEWSTQRPRTPVAIATVVGIAVLILSITSLSIASWDRNPSGPPVLPPAPDVPIGASNAEGTTRFAQQGITLTTGWRPTGLIEGGRAWDLARSPEGVAAWVDHLPRLRMVYDDAGRLFIEDATVITAPAPCYHLARVVRRIGVGLPPPIGPEIAGQLEAWLEPPYFSAVPTPDGRGRCGGIDPADLGFAIEQAEPLACVVPGRTTACFTLAKWRYDFGARDVWTSTHRAFDATTGRRLDDGELHPGLDLAAFDRLVDAAVCAFGGRCDGIPAREGRLHPTRTAIAVEFSPGEAADAVHGSLRLTIPRHALPIDATYDPMGGS